MDRGQRESSTPDPAREPDARAVASAPSQAPERAPKTMSPSPSGARTVPATASLSPSASLMLAIQSGAGNQAAVRVARSMLVRDPTTSTDVDSAPTGADERVKAALASGAPPKVRALDDAALAQTLAVQRAGLVKILLDQVWVDEADERLALKMIKSQGETSAVVGQLDALGYRQKLLDSVDEDGLHKELEGILGVPPGTATGPLGKALTSRDSADVMAIPPADIAKATSEQRIGLLQIMLDLSSSNVAEERKILDLIETGGVRATMSAIKGLGLKQSLFDHIDDDANKTRMTTMLTPLHDAELDADLLRFNQGFWSSLGSGISEGLGSAYDNFSLGKLISGMLAPIIHPVNTIMKHVHDGEEAIKSPSVDRIVSVIRDVLGTLGIYLLVAAGVVALVGAAVSAGIITLPAGIAIEGVAATLVGYATTCGIGFIALTAFKLLLDAGQAGASTTESEHKKESEEIGEDVTTLGVIAVLAGLLRGLGAIVKRLKGSAEDPAKAGPEDLKQQEADAKAAQEKAAADAAKLKEGADAKQGAKHVADRKPGNFDAAAPPKTPPDWTFIDKVEDAGDKTTASTNFESPTGAKGMARRSLNKETGALELEEINVPKEASWIKTEVELVEGKGTPTSSYLTMRLMHLLKIAPGSLKKVMIRNIWNLESILELHKKLGNKEKPLTADEAVAQTKSVTSQEAAMTQSGHKITGAKVLGGKKGGLGEVLDYWETNQETLKDGNRNQAVVDKHNADLQKAGFTREQALKGEFLYDYDIEIELKPIDAPAPPEGAGAPGLPTVVPVAPSASDDKKTGGI